MSSVWGCEDEGFLWPGGEIGQTDVQGLRK